MSSPAYRIIDRRSSAGYNSANTLIEAATQNSDRKQAPNVDYDVHRTVSSLGRRTLMNLGRTLFWKFPALQGLVLEQANVAVSTFIPQFAGKDKEWGKMAEAQLTEWHRIMDIAGWPYDYDTYLQNLVISPLVEGGTFTLLTQTPEGYPLIQVIPQHRCGGRHTSTTAVRVRYEGKSLFVDDIEIDSNRPYPAEGKVEFEARLIDGVIVDDYGRAIAYRVCRDNFASGEYQDVPARNLFPAFVPLVTGQLQGFSLLASSVFDWEDMAEWRRFELLAQKAFSTRTIIETNETGDVDGAKAVIKTGATVDDDGRKTSLDVQTLEGGTIQYLKAGTNSSVEAFKYDRPGAGSQNFMKTTLRDAFRGTEWDVFFSLDPSGIGGAPMRVIVDKINTVAAKRRKLVAKCCRRVDGYALAKFMQLGILPWNDEWYKWEYQGPAEVTADKKYDSDVDLQEVSQGFTTRKLACARRGLYLEDVDEQREREADSDLERAGRLAAKHGITIQEALVVLRPPSPSAQMPAQQSAPEPAKPTTEDEP